MQMKHMCAKEGGGFSLVEILIALAIFSLTVTAVAMFSSQVMQANKRNEKRVEAVIQIREATNVLLKNKDGLWMTILENADGTAKHLELTDGFYQVVDGPVTINGIELSFVVEGAQRDGEGKIVVVGGTEDIHTKRITVTGLWIDDYGVSKTLSSRVFVNDWNTRSWLETTTADFLQGTLTNTEHVVVGDGAIRLKPKLYSNWCLPELMMTSYDLPGNAVGNVVIADPGNAYVGTGKEFTDPGSMSFMHMTVNSADPPGVSVTGTFSGYVVNDIYGEPGYAYLATTNDSKEVVILDISQSPFVEIGSFNASGSGDGLAIYVLGNRGYLTQGRYLTIFDLSSKIGSRGQLGTILASPSQLWFMTALVTDVVVVGNYAYCSLYNDWYEMTIVNVTSPASMSITAKGDFNWAQATALFVSPDGNRAYIGTGSSSDKEFFIINTTNKASVSIVNSYEANGMSVKGLTVIDNRAILAGKNGEEYQVVDISNEANLVKCGGMQVNSGISDVATVNFGGILFSYVITGDTGGEFKVIRGGLDSGGGSDGRGYFANGTYISRVLDTGSVHAYYYSLVWGGTVPLGAELKLQVRSGDVPDLTGSSWVGPDGTGASNFSSSGELIHASVSGHRYFQYRATFVSNTDVTPIFETLSIEYQ